MEFFYGVLRSYITPVLRTWHSRNISVSNLPAIYERIWRMQPAKKTGGLCEIL